MAGSAIQYDPEMPGELTRQLSTAGAVRLRDLLFQAEYSWERSDG